MGNCWRVLTRAQTFSKGHSGCQARNSSREKRETDRHGPKRARVLRRATLHVSGGVGARSGLLRLSLGLFPLERALFLRTLNYTRTHVHAYVYTTCVYRCVSADMYTYVHTQCTRVCICIHIYVRVCTTHVSLYVSICTYMYVHICLCNSSNDIIF